MESSRLRSTEITSLGSRHPGTTRCIPPRAPRSSGTITGQSFSLDGTGGRLELRPSGGGGRRQDGGACSSVGAWRCWDLEAPWLAYETSLSLTASLRVQLPLAPPSALRSRGFLQGSLGRWCMRFCEVMDRAYSPLSPSSWPLRPFTFRLDATSSCVLPGP
jgi:hypothetical protein